MTSYLSFLDTQTHLQVSPASSAFCCLAEEFPPHTFYQSPCNNKTSGCVCVCVQCVCCVCEYLCYSDELLLVFGWWWGWRWAGRGHTSPSLNYLTITQTALLITHWSFNISGDIIGQTPHQTAAILRQYLQNPHRGKKKKKAQANKGRGEVCEGEKTQALG